MRNRLRQFRPVAGYMGALFWSLGLLLLVPLVPLAIYRNLGRAEVSPLCFFAPAVLAFIVGTLLAAQRGHGRLSGRGAMLVCALGWMGLSAVGCLPFTMALGVSYLDAYFETVSGFTTTGITMLSGLDHMPRSIIFWRAFIQWLGGLGILTFFLMVIGAGGGASHRLFSAESHKIFSRRPAPGLLHTLRILWSIYLGATVLIAALLVIAGSSVFDAVAHSFTCLSTGGYSPYDASIGHYAQVHHPHYVLIEYILILGMVIGGTNFFVHFRILSGEFRSLWDNLEMRLWWSILAGATVLVMLDRYLGGTAEALEPTVRHSLFQVVSIGTTTGFATQDIGGTLYPALAKQLFLVLMVIGGCVGSTGGGVKVMRIGVLAKMMGRQVRRVVRGRRAVNLLLIDGERIELEEVRRIGGLFFAWIALLAVGGGVTALLSAYGPLESASGMFSALGNIGPCYIPVEGMIGLHPVVKIVYIVGMLAGRLEILPIIMLFSRQAWR